ncbi:ParA family protein [bacterium]|nr:MAG: ParA family protein [bacterium]
MRQKTKVVAFAGQKGGTGKTTVAVAFASNIHYLLRKKVLVIDVDSPQYSLWTYRNTELNQLNENKKLAKAFEKQRIETYPIINDTIISVPRILDEYRRSNEFDIIIIDTPGTVNIPGYKECLMAVDYIVTPLEAEDMSLTSNLEFISFIINDILNIHGSTLKNYFVFWNKIRKTTNKDFFVEVHKSLVENGINIMDALVEDRVDYQRNVCRSTLFPISSSHQNSGLGHLIKLISKEILKSSTK